MSKVVVMDHPLIQHKIGIMRRTDTGSKDFQCQSTAVKSSTYFLIALRCFF